MQKCPQALQSESGLFTDLEEILRVAVRMVSPAYWNKRISAKFCCFDLAKLVINWLEAEGNRVGIQAVFV